jgi:hypothetical protein
MNEADSWIHFDEFAGGIVVFCALCGRKPTRKTYHASSTNYAEARRLATAYHWEHQHSEMHKDALSAYHGSVPDVLPEDELLYKVFGTPLPTEKQLRKQAARAAAATHHKNQYRRRR